MYIYYVQEERKKSKIEQMIIYAWNMSMYYTYNGYIINTKHLMVDIQESKVKQNTTRQ